MSTITESRLAVITGATSGLGAEFARQLAGQFSELWLIGRREDLLYSLANQLHAAHGCKAEVMVMDLGDAEAIESLSSRLTAATNLSLLINNAGYADDGLFHEMAWQQHAAIMNVHVNTTLRLCYSAMDHLVRNKGSIINVASVASFIPTPHSPLYGPTKAFIRSLSETLAAQYHQQMVKVQALCPGFTVTDFHERMGIDGKSFYKDKGIMRSWSAEFVVRESLQDLEQGKVVSVPGWNYKFIVFFLRKLPIRLVQKLFSRRASYRESGKTAA